MKIETQPRDDHQMTLVVNMEPAQLESAKRRAARRLSERRAVPGFRPGKAPYEMVLRTFGEGVVLEEAVDLLLDEIYPKALEEAKLEPAAPGRLEKVEGLEQGEPVFTFAVPLAPKVELGDYRSVRVPYEWKEPTEEEVEKAIQDMRMMSARTETVTRPVEKGDFVLIDLKGVKAKAAEGEAPLIERANMPVFVRPEPKEDEWPYSGFAHELIGAAPGETKTFTHKFPKDHPDETLKGQTVKFEATVRMVRGTILPELNDEFARQIGPFESLQGLRETLKADLAARSKAEYDDEFFEKVLEAMKAGAVIKYAPQTLEEEVEQVVKDFKSRLAAQNMDLETYLKIQQVDQEKFMQEVVRPIAIKRLERSLLLDEISRAEKIEIGEEELKSSLNDLLYEMSGDEEMQKYLTGKAKMPKRLSEALILESASRAYVRQTLKRLKLIATGNAPAQTEEAQPAADADKAAAQEKPARSRKRAPKASAGEKPAEAETGGGSANEADSPA